MKDQQVPLAKKIDQMLTEARVILPGAQALLGFQLAVILTQAFENCRARRRQSTPPPWASWRCARCF